MKKLKLSSPFYDDNKNNDKMFKERMKDRYKINGVKFDYSNKEEEFALPKKKEKEKNVHREYDEFMLLQNYNKLKHKIFLREQKEKEIEEQELFKEIHQDFNYTNITKIITQFISKKNDKNNPFNYNMKHRKNAIERANRNIKKNRINEALKKVVLHFTKIKGKLNIKKENRRGGLIISENVINEIKNKIVKQKRKLNSRNSNSLLPKTISDFNNRSSNNINNNINKNFIRKSRSCCSNLYGNRDYINVNMNNSMNYKMNHALSSSSLYEIKHSFPDKNTTNNSYNKNRKSIDHNISKDSNIKDKFNRKSFYFKKSKEYREIHNMKKEIQILNSLLPNLADNNSNSSILNNNYRKNIQKENDNSNILIEDKNKSIKDYNKINGQDDKYNMDQKGFKTMLKSSSCKFRPLKRPKSCMDIKSKRYLIGVYHNFNYNNNKGSFIKSKKNIRVKNLPLYTTKITDLIKEFNRIKNNAKKLKINYKEKHFSTYEEIENIVKIKEDMLMFLLKQKYFNCKFPQKIVKPPNYKKIFVEKMKDYVEFTEDRPTTLINMERLFD